MKLTTCLAAAGLLAASPLVWAQTQPQREPQATKPPPSATAPAEKMQPEWYKAQGGEIRASKLLRTKVVNTANETIGDINEVILSKDGRVAAVVLGVGGFLGMGEREVAVDFSSLKIAHDGDKTVVTINATKDVLKNAPEWKWASDRSGTTRTSPPPANRPAK